MYCVRVKLQTGYHDRNDMYSLSDTDRQQFTLTFGPELNRTVGENQYHFRPFTAHAQLMQNTCKLSETQKGHRWVVHLNPATVDQL